jgi:prepilin-type N-terminal cleavage/methylation domain-containing protein
MNNKGMTLVELLIVIVVVSILAGFGAVAVSEILTNTREKSFVANLEIIVDASITAHSSGSDIWDDDIATLRELTDSKFIESLGKDPWGGEYDLDETFVTIEEILVYDDTTIYLSNNYMMATETIFKGKIVSSTAIIGYDEELEAFDKSDIVYLDNSNASLIDRIVEVFNGDADEDLTTDNGHDDINVNDDIQDSANIETLGGDDTITIGDDIKGNSSVNTGDGNDTINMDGEVTGSSSVETGDGDDTINIQDDIQDNSVVTTGNGNDSVYIGDDLQNGALLDTGNGNDTVEVDGDFDKGNLNTGDGDDDIDINKTKNTSNMNTGNGNDTVYLYDVSSTFKGSINLGADDDTLTIIDSRSSKNLSGTSGTFDGGSGNDTLNLPNVTIALWNSRVSSLFTNFETVNLKDGVVNP